ncbi:helix-turn-helix domain-containing protein [Streptomyces sp. WM6378]|uniref:helix-turn-helix domain-containing protein n=1 Tax=Streptomyces sp. WM6378 TaxID=1415557 RepID=UPI0006B02E82|nr:helix-turn-helix transcriptional regulator [Streptomyces sp. WM6378]KOU37573.1 DNA-binding protein [Streptomyces sp. WM6378]
MAWDHEAHDGEPDSSDSLRTFGAVVQALREHAGLSREDLAALVGYSKHTVASVELGRRMAYPDFIEGTEAATGNTGALKKAARYLSREPGLASWFRKWARFEREAISLDTYECRMVPGLLQTERYVQALFENRIPPLSDEQMAERLAARVERQKLLRERPNTSYSFIIDEAVLERRIGGTEVTRELLDHILDATNLRNVDLQIMPLRCTSHACLDGALQLLITPEGRHLAYSEGQQNGRLISDPKEVALLSQRYATLRSQALTPEESRGLLERMRGAL